MKEEQKEVIKAIKDLLNPFLYATKCGEDEDVLSGGVIYNIPMAVLEIAKALNRIADKI